MNARSGQVRLVALVSFLALLLGAWGVATWQVQPLRPSLEKERDLLVRLCRQVFEDYGQGREQYWVAAETSLRREFLIFGAPLGTVLLSARFVDVRGDDRELTGRYHFRSGPGGWMPETVSGYDILEYLSYTMQAKYPLRASELRIRALGIPAPNRQ